MEPKNRLLVTLAVIALIAGAMLVSFGRNLVALNTPHVVLADASGSGSSTSDGSQSASSAYQRVEVTPAPSRASSPPWTGLTAIIGS